MFNVCFNFASAAYLGRQNKFAVTGHAQPILAAGMLDNDLVVVTEQLAAVQPARCAYASDTTGSYGRRLNVVRFFTFRHTHHQTKNMTIQAPRTGTIVMTAAPTARHLRDSDAPVD